MPDPRDAERATHRLADLDAIRSLKARYFRCMDTRDWHAMRDVFARDAVMDFRDEMAGLTKFGMTLDPAAGLFVGRDAIVAGMRAPLENIVTAHHGHMPEIDFVGDDEARGVWAMEDIIELPEGGAHRRLHGYGHYHESYVREADRRWRIKQLRLTRLLVELA